MNAGPGTYTVRICGLLEIASRYHVLETLARPSAQDRPLEVLLEVPTETPPLP